MRGFGSSLEQISNKLLSAEAAVEVVKPGHRVFIGTVSGSPFSLVEALERRKPTPPDVELFYFLTTGLAPLWVEQQSAYHHRCFFVGSEARAGPYWAGRICPDLADPNPVFDGERSLKG
jgi:acyl-CoA hydrolase